MATAIPYLLLPGLASIYYQISSLRTTGLSVVIAQRPSPISERTESSFDGLTRLYRTCTKVNISERRLWRSPCSIRRSSAVSGGPALPPARPSLLALLQARSAGQPDHQQRSATRSAPTATLTASSPTRRHSWLGSVSAGSASPSASRFSAGSPGLSARSAPPSPQT